jgi:leucyl aminopeptidase (aminopeptidase T)
MTSQADHLAQILRKPLELNAKAGDRILIMTDTNMDPGLWQGLHSAALALDMEPMVTIMKPRATHSTNPPEAIRQAALASDVDLCIYLTSTAMAHSKLTDEFIDKGKRFILMEELTPAMLAADGPASVDYFALNALGLALAKVFSEGENIHVTCPNGTDLTASIKGRAGRSIAGLPLIMKPGGGGGCAFPDGEAHVCPVEGTGEGMIVFDVTAHNVGLIEEPMRLTVEKGWVTKIEGGREADIWRKLLAQFEDANNYNCPAEIAIGLNPRVTPTGSMRTDKKMYGCSHIGIGDTIALGGTCHARLRLEGVIRAPEITVDGQVLTRGGDILLDDGTVGDVRQG